MSVYSRHPERSEERAKSKDSTGPTERPSTEFILSEAEGFRSFLAPLRSGCRRSRFWHFLVSSFPHFLLFILLAVPCQGRTVYVNAASPDANPDGASWTTAFPTVQQGINASSDGDEVWVAAGTYKENISLKSGAALLGGFAGSESGHDQRDPKANVTILDGQNKATVVTIATGATSATVLDGFTIRNGYGPVIDNNGAGGGVYVIGGTPVISNNVVTGCIAGGGRTITSTGGGIYVAAGMPLISGNTITNNYAMFGGGICAYGGLIRDNVIAYNAASHPYLVYGAGGGVCAWSPRVVVVHNLIQGNQAPDPYGGGGGLDSIASPTMDNVFRDNKGLYAATLRSSSRSTVLRNTITNADSLNVWDEVWFDGGVFSDNLLAGQTGPVALSLGNGHPGNTDGTEPVIVNNTIVHEGVGGSYGIVCYYHTGEKPTFSNNIIKGWGKPSYSYIASGTPPVFTTDHNDIYGNTDNTLNLPGASPIGVNGNISQEPLFVDPANGDYRLQAGSPCIDAGNDAYVSSTDRDIAGAPRIYGAHVDIGAYESGSSVYTMLDAAEVLRIAAGISIATPANISRLDVVPQSPGLTVSDATRIAQWLLN